MRKQYLIELTETRKEKRTNCLYAEGNNVEEAIERAKEFAKRGLVNFDFESPFSTETSYSGKIVI